METTVGYLPKLDLANSQTHCCALIDPTEWDEKTFTFENKLFAKVASRSILHIPLNMNQIMTKAQADIDKVDARADDGIVLSDEISPWHADHYIAVTRDVPDLEMVKLSGTFMTKVFEGPYKNAGLWRTQLIDYVEDKGKRALRTYFFYTVCPDCAKAYGKNYVVGFEKID